MAETLSRVLGSSEIPPAAHRAWLKILHGIQTAEMRQNCKVTPAVEPLACPSVSIPRRGNVIR
jgi:hypothetical protein